MELVDLAARTCVPCNSNTPSLEGAELEELLVQIPDWKLVEEHHIRREFRFKNFREALEFVNQVGELAEEEGHHPNISFTWGRVEIEIFTHAIGGLSESDLILAAKIDRLG